MTGNTIQLIGMCLMAIFIIAAIIYILTFKKRRNKLLKKIQEEY